RLHVDGDERLADAIAPEVQQAGRQFLSGAALALDEHGRPAGRDTLHELEQRPALGTLRDDAVGTVARPDLLAEVAVLALEPDELERPRDQRAELVVVEGLGEVVEGALAHRRHGRGDTAVGGDEDHRQRRAPRVHRTHERHPAHAGHLPAGDHDVGAVLLERPQRGGAAGARLGLVAGPGERRRHDLRHAGLVVHDQDAGAHATAPTGSLTVNRAPPPTRSPTSIVPPCASTIWRATASPRPVPRGRVVKKGSKMRPRISLGMPGPSSETASSTPFPAPRASTVTEPPGAAASPAFESRPSSTWQTRSPSAVIVGSEGACARCSRTPRAARSLAARSAARATTS